MATPPPTPARFS